MNPLLLILVVFLSLGSAYGSIGEEGEEALPLVAPSPATLLADAYTFTPIDGIQETTFLKDLRGVSISGGKESIETIRALAFSDNTSLEGVMIADPPLLAQPFSGHSFTSVRSMILTDLHMPQTLPSFLGSFPNLEELVFMRAPLGNFHKTTKNPQEALEKYIECHVVAVSAYLSLQEKSSVKLHTLAFPASLARTGAFTRALTKPPLSFFAVDSKTRPCETGSQKFETLWILKRHIFENLSSDTCRGCTFL